MSPSSHAPPDALRVGEFLASFSLCLGFQPPEEMKAYFKEDGTFCSRITRSGDVYVCGVEGATQTGCWARLCSVSDMRLITPAAPRSGVAAQFDPHVVFIGLNGDEFGVLKRRRGDLVGYYGCYFLALEDRAACISPLYYLPPGADAGPLVRLVAQDLVALSKSGVQVYDAFSMRDALVRVYPCLGLFYFPMAAKFSNSVGPSGVEQSTSCDIVGLKTKSNRLDRAVSSTTIFDVRDVRYARIQERTIALESSVKGSDVTSNEGRKAALIETGISKDMGSHFMMLEESRGPRSFDIHEHVIVAPSHLLYYGMASPLLKAACDALGVSQRDAFLRQMRAVAPSMPYHSVLSSFEPAKILLIPEFCRGGQRQRLTVNNSTLLV